MKKFTKEMVDNYANNCLIGLSAEENKMVLDEFEVIDHDIDIINTIKDIDNVEPMTHPLKNFKYELRDDIALPTPNTDEILRNAGKTIGSEVEVPKVV
jgi:aspartyl/glutamyl-tRNA(Asn/Gln) amidotransferase C subunit